MLHSPPLVTASAAVMFAVGFAAAVHAGEPAVLLKPAQVAALGLQTVTIAADEASAAARYPATIVVPSSQQRVVAAPLPGLVEALQVSVGDTVRAGQVLAVLRSAQAQELQHDVHVTRSQASLAAAARTRDEQLFKEGLISSARLETTRVQAGLALEQREERHRALLQAGGSVNGAGGSITLTAPIGGVVLERQVVVGQRLDQAAPLYRIAILSPLWLEMQIPAGEASSVRLGDAVAVLAPEARGRVIVIGHTVDAASQTVLVRAELRAPSAELRAGHAVVAQLERTVPGLTHVPTAAVVHDAGKTVVFVETGAGEYRATPVQAVGGAGGLSAVRGLAAGSKVVVQGTAALKSLLATQPK